MGNLTASSSKEKYLDVVISGGCPEISFIAMIATTSTIATLKWLADWFTASKIRFFIVRVRLERETILEIFISIHKNKNILVFLEKVL